MKSPQLRNVRLIFSREFRDQLRDRRTLFMIGVLPLLLYPLIGMSFMQMAQFMRRNVSQVLVVSNGDWDASSFLDEDKIRYLPSSESELTQVELRQAEFTTVEEITEAATALIESQAYDAIVFISPGFDHQGVSHGRTHTVADEQPMDAAGQPWPAEPMLFYSTSRDRSRMAYDRINMALILWRQAKVNVALEKHAVTGPPDNPFATFAHDISPPSTRRAAAWSKILPFVLVIWSMTGAFYPAVDLCAGEKERGTLETLLCSPAERSEIVWGKLLTVWVFSIATAVLNLTCMTLTSSYIGSQFAGLVSGGTIEALGTPPMGCLVWLLVALLPISALFSALSLALATMAGSTKEGQYYLMPLILLTMPLLILPMLPSVELDLGLAIVPVAGVVLLLRQLMENNLHEAMLYFAPVTIVTGGCCWIAIRWAIDQFSNESVLFRESERFSLRAWMVQLFRDRTPTPSPAQALLCGVVIILVRFFLGLAAAPPTDWRSFSFTVTTTLVGLVLVPAILFSLAFTTRPWLTMLMRRCNGFAIAAAAALAVSLHPAGIALVTVVRSMYPIDASVTEPFGALLAQAPNLLSLLFFMALLPAVCEEFAFRGFILSGFRHLGHRWRAILLSALLFGLAHGVLQQSIVASIFGVVLGFLAVQSGSIWPCIAFHACHNALGVLASRWINILVEQGWDTGFVLYNVSLDGVATPIYGPAVVAVGLAMAAVILHWFANLPSEKSSEERLQDAIENQIGQPVTV